VIILHGWFGDHSVYEPMFPYLDTETFTYAFMNYRGYGLSKDMTGEHSMAEIAADAIGLADHLGWDRFHVFGHSMGGKAMQRVALDAPGRVKSGIAVTPVPAKALDLDAESEALFSGAADSDEKRRFILDFTTGNRLSGVWLDLRVRQSRETTTRNAYADYFTAFAKTGFEDEVKGLDLPVLVLVGEHDPAFTAEVMKQTYLAWLPKARMEVIPNAGHYPMQETPVDLATRMEAFLREHAG
ncbi:MAG: alpha/beta hydrolase, partial [Rhodospirillales bacterium]|nr:alpha/beta hydrolase [Rhodospirillales bacterium]